MSACPHCGSEVQYSIEPRLQPHGVAGTLIRYGIVVPLTPVEFKLVKDLTEGKTPIRLKNRGGITRVNRRLKLLGLHILSRKATGYVLINRAV